MHTKILLITTLSILFIACKQTQTANVDASQFSNSNYTVEAVFGESFDIGSTMSVNTVAEALESQDTVEMIMEANIESVCKVKGCWMNLVDIDDPGDKEFFVKFKDYGFFVPLDSEGYRVLVKGKAFKEITSVDELRHYAEDEGKSAEEIAKITEPAEELKVMSTGVYKVKI